MKQGNQCGYVFGHVPALVRTGHGTRDWFQIGKGVRHPTYLTYMQSTS